MAPDESNCENFMLGTSYKLYFNLKRGLWATEHPPNKISYSSSGIFFTVRSDWTVTAHFTWSSSWCNVSNLDPPPWSSFKFLNQFRRSVSHVWFTFWFTLKSVFLNPDKTVPSSSFLSLHLTDMRVSRLSWQIWACDNGRSVPSCQCCLINTW